MVSVVELVVNGGFAMDTVDTSTEVALARESLARHPHPDRVLVGGLGLGFTAREVLRDRRVRHLDVVELAAPLVRWARAGLVSELAGLEDDPRCRLHAGDVAAALSGTGGPPGPWDLVLLDVDNGPGFLLHETNAALYAASGLAAARARLTGGGVLAVWSSQPAPELAAALAEVAGPGDEVGETGVEVRRGGRVLDYVRYSLTRRA